MKLKAYAKINLSLRVLGRRPDGFHEIESVMQSVSLHDVITLTEIEQGIEVTCDNPSVPLGKDNLVYKAAELFFREADSRRAEKPKSGVGIHIEKNIPLAAGLAGGSANAAAVLSGLNRLSAIGYRLSDSVLLELGAQIGSDVPFCLIGGTGLVKGRGEIVEKQPDQPKTAYIIVKPGFDVSAKFAYGAWDSGEWTVDPDVGIGASSGLNDLEQVVTAKYPVIAEIKQRLLDLGCPSAQMSGSGPSVFGVVSRDGERILARIKQEYPQSFMVESVGAGISI